MQKGAIALINNSQTAFVLQSEQRWFALFESQETPQLRLGDVICGHLEATGAERLKRLNDGLFIDAYGLSGPCTKEECKRTWSQEQEAA